MQDTQVLIPGSGRSPGEGNSNPLQYSGLENSVDTGAWQATVHRVAKSQTQLSNVHTHIHTHTHTHEEVYYEELADEITETERTHSLLSPGWRPRKASGMIQLESEDLRTGSTKSRGRLTSCLKSSGRKGQVFPLPFGPISGAVLIR